MSRVMSVVYYILLFQDDAQTAITVSVQSLSILKVDNLEAI